MAKAAWTDNHTTAMDSFCFLEMPFENQASAAVREANGKKPGEYALTIKESELSI
jgi:hypothetical protein